MKKSDYCVIGLGRFGQATIDTLTRLRQNVIAIDTDKKRIEDISRKVNYAVALDSTNIDVMRDAGIDQIPNVIVTISEDLETNLMTCAVLKDLKVPNIIARGLSDHHEQILRAIGITNIIRPESKAGNEAALRAVYKVGVEISEIGKNYSIMRNTVTNSDITGKTLFDLKLREKWKVNVILLSRQGKSLFPDSDLKIQLGDVITYLVKNDDIWDINNLLAGKAEKKEKTKFIKI